MNIEAGLPDNFAIGRDECLQRCGLSRGTQPTTQRQPRVSGNALPDNSTSSDAPSATDSSSSSWASSAAPTPTPLKREYVPVQVRKRD